MPAPTTSIGGWARIALIGDADATSPSDSTLTALIGSVTADLAASNPCIGTAPLTDLSTQADVDAFAEWAGYMVAARYVSTPAGARLVGETLEVEVGPVRRKGTAMNATTAATGYARAGMLARLRVSCIREAQVTANNAAPSVFGLSGRRRELGEPSTLEGLILGTGEGT